MGSTPMRRVSSLTSSPRHLRHQEQSFCTVLTEKPKICFVLFDDDEDNENPTVFMTKEETPSTEPARQTLPSTIPVTDLTIDNDDEPWSAEVDHRSGWVVVWNTVLFCAIIRNSWFRLLCRTRCFSTCPSSSDGLQNITVLMYRFRQWSDNSTNRPRVVSVQCREFFSLRFDGAPRAIDAQTRPTGADVASRGPDHSQRCLGEC